MAFKVGETVRLKSGGPLMTVTGFGKDAKGTERVNCSWFDKTNSEQTATFPPDAIEASKNSFGIA